MKKLGGGFRKFSNWQNGILNSRYGEDSTTLFFAKTMAYILIFCTLTMVVLNTYFILASSQLFSASTRFAFLPVYIVPVIAFIMAYRSLMLGGYKRARNIFTGITILAIIVSINMTGGFFNSDATPFLVVVPVMVYLLFGMRAGTTIAFAVPVFIALQTAAMALLGLKFPNFTSTANPDMNVITTNLSLYLLVIAMVASYEIQRNILRKAVKKERDKLAELANRDPLTGLANSRHFHDVLKTQHQLALENNTRLAILYLDLNRFKQINDEHGHLVGDTVLIEVARRISLCLGDNAIATRMGGDEFVILLHGQLASETLPRVRTSIAVAMATPIVSLDHEHKMGFSIGQSVYPDEATTLAGLLKCADERMYQDKHQQRSDRIRLELGSQVQMQNRA